MQNNMILPLSLEFEELEQKLNEKFNKSHNRILKRLVTPGVCNSRGNQQTFTFEELNTKPAYPQEYIPYSHGVIWE